mgnify:CR=1 FL=1
MQCTIVSMIAQGRKHLRAKLYEDTTSTSQTQRQMYCECQSRGRVHIHTKITGISEISSTGKMIPQSNASRSESLHRADWTRPGNIWMLMHADVNMDTHAAEEVRLHKKRKHSKGDPLCPPQLNDWYTMHDLKNLLGEKRAKIEASTAPNRFSGQGYDKPCIEEFLITHDEETFKKFYVPPPHGYPRRP